MLFNQDLLVPEFIGLYTYLNLKTDKTAVMTLLRLLPAQNARTDRSIRFARPMTVARGYVDHGGKRSVFGGDGDLDTECYFGIAGDNMSHQNTRQGNQ